MVSASVSDWSKMLEISRSNYFTVALIMKIIVTSIQLNSQITKKTVTQIYPQKILI